MVLAIMPQKVVELDLVALRSHRSTELPRLLTEAARELTAGRAARRPAQADVTLVEGFAD